MPEISVDVYCGTCGAGLCGQSEVSGGRRGGIRIDVVACEKCTKERYDEGYHEGRIDVEEGR